MEKKTLYSSCKDMRDVVAIGSLSHSSQKNATEICLNYNAKSTKDKLWLAFLCARSPRTCSKVVLTAENNFTFTFTLLFIKSDKKL